MRTYPSRWRLLGGAFLLFGAASLAAAQEELSQTRRIVVRVAETAGIRRFGYPARAVLVLPQPVKDVEHFRLLDGDKSVAAQFSPHGDTSEGIRSVSLDFNASPAPLEKREYIVEYGPDVTGNRPKSGLRVETLKDEFRISHPGDLQFIVPRRLIGMLRQVQTTKTKYLRAHSRGLVFQDKEGNVSSAGEVGPKGQLTVQSEVVKEGPLAVGLRFVNTEAFRKGTIATSTVEMEFPISKSWVEVTWTVADPKGDIAGLGADVNLHVEGEPTLVDFGAGTFVYAQLRKGQTTKLRQLQEHEFHAKGVSWETLVGPTDGKLSPYVVAPPSRARRAAAFAQAEPAPAEGWAHVMDRERCTAVAVAHFAAANQGAEIAADSDGRLRLWKYFGKSGATDPKGRKQLKFWLHFVGMPVHVGAATSPQAMLAPLQIEVKSAP